uniref:RNA-directed DNA polymerase n=1 Tax=Globodera rostochiensis TaxID=31243 RepID=A0A914HA85_GLORO
MINSFGLFPAFPADDSAGTSSAKALAKWLHTPRGDSLPKGLKCSFCSTGMERLKMTFVNSTSPVNFIICVWDWLSFDGIMPFELINNLTGERLVFRHIKGNEWLLVRCPIELEEVTQQFWRSQQLTGNIFNKHNLVLILLVWEVENLVLIFNFAEIFEKPTNPRRVEVPPERKMDAATLQRVLDNVLAQSEARVQQMLKAATPANNDLANANLTNSIDARIGKFNYDPENGHTFDQWFKRYGKIIEEDGKELPEATKVRLLLGKMADEEYSKYRDSVSPTLPDQIKWAETLTNLKELFAETRSLFVRRYDCFKIRQQPRQDITSLVALINASCENANLSLTKEELKCIILVIALRDENHDLRQKCLKMLEDSRKTGTAITLKKVEEELRTIQLVKESALSLMSPPVATNAIRARPQQWRGSKIKPHLQQHGEQRSHNQQSGSISTEKGKPFRGPPTHPCGSCGLSNHWRAECRLKDAICSKCQRKGHIAKVCRQTANAPPRKNRSFLSIGVKTHLMAMGTTQPRYWKILITINGVQNRMNVDTGAQATIIPLQTWIKLGKPALSPSDIEAKNCNGEPVPINGKFECVVKTSRSSPKTLTAYVSKTIEQDLLGLPWIEQLEIIPTEILFQEVRTKARCNPSKTAPQHPTNVKDAQSLISALQSDFSEVFSSDLGRCTKAKAHLILKPDAKPVYCKARPVPHGAIDAVNDELDRLLKIGAIKPIEFSHWAAPILAVKKKNGKTRVCIDFSTGLNNALELNRHPLPRPENIYAALNGAAYFSNLDLRDAYLQMELDPESQQLCALNTHRGLFQCQRLPFGVKSAPSIFQHLMDQICAGIPGVFAYLDDGLIATKTLEQHLSAIYQLFTRIKEFGLRIQLEKCKFLQKELLFLGHIISAEGIRPDPSRSKAIRQMPPPHDVSTLRSFLGALNYYGKFVKEMREIRAPLDQLLRKDISWNWKAEQQTAFEKAKEIMTSDLLLTHYDPSLQMVVAADASKDGIGATISHIWPDKSEKVIEHASCTLSDAQQNYSQIEKEALALIFAVQKFHRMLFGHKFTLLTDHKPLLAIFGSKKGIPIYSASRLQRWALIMTNYDFVIKYVNTAAFGQADVLSRLIANYPRPEEDRLIANICTETECYISTVLQSQTDQLPITAKEIAEVTAEDEILSEILRLSRSGWPKKVNDPEFAPYFPKRDEIIGIEGCLMYQQRIIVPSLLRARALKTLHMSHPGIVRMKALARRHFYWPGLDSAIEKVVRECEECQNALKAPTKAPLAPWPPTSQAFQRVHIDFAGPCEDGHMYLILVDSFSKWPEVCLMNTTTSSATIKVLRSVIYRSGVPEEIVSDNGTQFRSAEFAGFCKEFGIKHTFTPPFHPQSNGQVERFVDTFKRAMKKCAKGDKLWAEKMLLSYRTTPSAVLNGHSPDQLFFGRKLRTTLSLIHPRGEQREFVDQKDIRKSQLKYSSQMTKQFDEKHGAKPSEFGPQDPVLLLNYKLGKAHWLPGTIVERVRHSPTYRVLVPSLGKRIVHRHANQLRRRFAFEEDGPTTDREPIPTVHADENHQPPKDQQLPQGSPPLAVRRSRRTIKPRTFYSPPPARKSRH